MVDTRVGKPATSAGKKKVHLIGISGYRLSSGAFDLSLPKQPKSKGVLGCYEVLGLLAGQNTLSQLTKLHAESRQGSEKELGLILDRDGGAFAVPLPLAKDVTPGAYLRSKDGKTYQPDLCVLFTAGLENLISVSFVSRAVSAMVQLAAKSFRGILLNPEKAFGRLMALKYGKDFLPEEPAKRDMLIVSHWPEWRKKNLNYYSMAYELSEALGIKIANLEHGKCASQNLRKQCSRGLDLV